MPPFPFTMFGGDTAPFAINGSGFNWSSMAFLQPLDATTFTTSATTARINAAKALGSNWARVPFDPTGWLGAASGAVEAQQIADMLIAVNAMRAGGFKVLLDNHVSTFAGAYQVGDVCADYLLYAANPATGPKYIRMRALMAAIGTALKPYGSSVVALQLWNEGITGVLTNAQWRAMNLDLHGAVRAVNANIYLFVSGNNYSGIDGLAALDPTGFDARTVFCFTPYIPQLVTHQGLNDGSFPGYVGGTATPAFWPPIPSDKQALWTAAHSAMVATYPDPSSFTCTISNASPGVVTKVAHGLTTNQIVYFTTTGALPLPLTPNTYYWVTVIDADTFKLSTLYGNAAPVNTTTAGSGTHTCQPLQLANVSLNCAFIETLTQTGGGAGPRCYDQTWLEDVELVKVTDWMTLYSIPAARVCMSEFGISTWAGGLGPAPQSALNALTSFMCRWARTTGIMMAWWDWSDNPFAIADPATFVYNDQLLIALNLAPSSRAYDAPTNAIVGAMSGLTTRQQDLIYQFVKPNVDSGAWAKFFSLYIKVAGTLANALIDWKNPADPNCTLAVNGTMNFTAYQGMTSNGTTGFLDAPSNPLSGKFLQNDCAVGCFMGSSLTNGTYGLSIPNDTAGHVFINVASDYFVPMLDGNFDFTGISPQSYNWRNGVGLGFADRSGAADIQVYQNGSLTGSIAKASTAAGFGYIEEFRSFGSSIAPATAINYATVYSASLTAAQHAIFYATLYTLLAELGAPM